MIIRGVDFHPEFEQVASVKSDTGEFREQRLQHREEAETFYRELAAQGIEGRIGMEASGHARWLERLLAELQLERWIGDAAEIRTQRVRKQKTDRQDAQLILQLLLEDGFPRIWVPSWENRDITSTILWRRFLRSTEVPVTEPQKFRFGNRIESPLQIFPLRQPPTAGECKRQPKRT